MEGLVSLFFALLEVAVVVVFVVLPYLMPKGEFFAYYVKDADDAYLRGLNHRYSAIVGAVGALATVISVAYGAVLLGSAAQLGLLLVTFLLPIVVAFLLFVLYHGRVARYATSHGQAVESRAKMAVVGEVSPRPISPVWCLLYLIPIVITAAFLFLHYEQLLPAIPVHIDVTGQVQSIEKTPFSAGLPIYIELFFAAVFSVTVAIIGRSKRPLDSDFPELSAYAYGAYARAQSMLLVGMGLLLIAVEGGVMAASFAGALSMQVAFLLLVLALVCILTVVILVSVAYGQNGSRLLKRLVSEKGAQPTQVVIAFENSAWKAGLVYFNPEDPAAIVPKRFGIGWTCNFARPSVWVGSVAFLGVVVGFVVLIMAAM